MKTKALPAPGLGCNGRVRVVVDEQLNLHHIANQFRGMFALVGTQAFRQRCLEIVTMLLVAF